MVDFVAQTGLIAGLSGISAQLQGQVNVVCSVAVYLDFIDIPQHLRLLQTNILLLWSCMESLEISIYLIESIELIGEVISIIGNIQPMVE